MAAGDPGVLQRNYSAIAVETTLTASISASSQGASGTIIVGSVAGYPSTAPYTLVLEPDTSREEVITVTGNSSGTTLTVLRGQDNTQALAHSAGVSVRHAVSARDFKEEKTHAAARGYDIDQAILDLANQTHVHGIVTGEGVVVGTLKSQTLTQKTLTTPIVNGATITGTVTASTATFVSPTISGSPVITGLSSSSLGSSSAAPVSYVDAFFGPLTSAQTSAASAATSATAAATSAASAATSATTAANSASAAATSATSAAASATAAATSATSAATSASSALTSATSAATSATSAANSATTAAASVATIASYASAAATSATSAATSATSAAASATAAATSASSAAASTSAAATSATSAAASATAAATSASSALTSQTAAATSATSAAASATAAATSATSAAASATAAATSATSAAASATAAASSATSAAASWDEFDDRYLGAKSTPPTVDNDGNPLATGAIYFRTTDNNMYAWSGSAWVVFTSASAVNTVTAGSGLAGGGSGTTVTLTLDMDAKGDLLVGTGADTATKLTAATTNGYILSIDSSTTSGLSWVAPNPGDITGVTAGTGLTGGGTSGSVTLNLDTTGVTTGTYTLSTITVDAYGRITSASTGVAAGETFNPLLLMGA